MNKKKVALIFTPLLLATIGVGIYFGVTNNLDEEDVNNNETVDQFDYSYSNIYLMENSKALIPLTIKYEKFDTLGEELIHVINMLKEDSKVTNSTFKGLLPKDCFVKSLNLKDGLLQVDFDSNFANYDVSNELKIVESLVWTLTDFSEVNQIKLLMEGEELTNMPVNNTPLNDLTRNVGINNYLLTTSMIFEGDRVLSYYEKIIDESTYYVPVTHYVKNNDNLSLYDLTVQTMFNQPDITSSLKVCEIFKDTYMVNSSILNENILYLSLSEDILFDETTVSYDVYELLKETTTLLEDVNDVSFLFDLEEVLVNGKAEEQENVQVSKSQLNKYYI